MVTQSTIAESPTDPNFISGPSGYGTAGFVTDGGAFPYAINFENKPSAPAPAQVVEVTQQLDPDLDWSTFQLGDFSFGGQLYAVPAGLKSYQTRIDARGTTGVYVDVDASFDEQTGVVTWTFTSIDPTTLDVPAGNPQEGFLPPDNTSDAGEGFVTYIVAPKSTDTTGTVIDAKATVTFQAGLPDQSSLDTAPISNTIDVGAPTSSVTALPASSPPMFTVALGRPGRRRRLRHRLLRYLRLRRRRPVHGMADRHSDDLGHLHGAGRPYLRLLQRGDRQRRPCPGDAGHRADNHHGPRRAANEPRGGLGRRHLWWDRHADGHPDRGRRALAGQTVTFTLTVGGITTSVGTATTGSNGVATLRLVSLAGRSAGTAAGAVGAGFAGDASDAPTSASGDLVVARATPQLSWADPADIVYGTALGPAQLDASASFAGHTLSGTFTYMPAEGTVLQPGGGQILSVHFTPNDTTDFEPATATVSINVAPAPVTVLGVGWQTRHLTKRKTSKVLVIGFSGALDPGAARMLGDYQLATVVKAKKVPRPHEQGGGADLGDV